jgi:hypothetical protein
MRGVPPVRGAATDSPCCDCEEGADPSAEEDADGGLGGGALLIIADYNKCPGVD